jgi:hypothetical protein
MEIKMVKTLTITIDKKSVELRVGDCTTDKVDYLKAALMCLNSANDPKWIPTINPLEKEIESAEKIITYEDLVFTNGINGYEL